MKTRPRDIVIAARFGLALVVGYGCYLLSALLGSSVEWPPVNDPAVLLRECATLLDHAGQAIEPNSVRSIPGQVEEPNWPASVRSLKPVRVYARKGYVGVMISTGGIGPAWGYLVYPDGRSETAAPSGLLIRSLVCPGLFRYVTDE
jgi:hypothetical protein